MSESLSMGLSVISCPSMSLGDSFSKVFESWGWNSFIAMRSNVIIIFTIFVLLPLSSLKQLNALKYTSVIGILGMFYCALFMVIRFHDQSYSVHGRFYLDLESELRPSFDREPLAPTELVRFKFPRLDHDKLNIHIISFILL